MMTSNGSWLVSVALVICAGFGVVGYMSQPAEQMPQPQDERFFDEPLMLESGMEWRMYPVIVDFDKDGDLDIVAAHRRPLHENSLHIFLNNGKREFNELTPAWSSPGYSGLGVGDINSDGALDIVAASHFSRIHTYISKGTEPGQFVESLLPGLSDGYVLTKIADLDNDGRNEVIVLGNERAGIEIYRWDEGVGLVRQAEISDGNIGRDLEIADMNNDGRPDLVVSQARIGVSIFYQSEDKLWKAAPPTDFYSATKEFHSIEVADFNRDGKPDVALNGGYSGVLEPNGPDVYLAHENSWKAASEGLKVFKSRGDALAVDDVNKDGWPDLIVAGNDTGGIDKEAYGLFLFVSDQKGGWTLVKNSGLPEKGLAKVYGITVTDLDKDGSSDFVVTHGDPDTGYGYLSVWYARS